MSDTEVPQNDPTNTLYFPFGVVWSVTDAGFVADPRAAWFNVLEQEELSARL